MFGLEEEPKPGFDVFFFYKQSATQHQAAYFKIELAEIASGFCSKPFPI